MPSRVSRFTVAASSACGALGVVELASGMGATVPRTGAVVVGAVAAVLAATAAIRNVAYVWRGPLIVSFRRGDGTLCDARESAAIRAAAQLRGTMGGAGHVYPRRLALSAAAWAASSFQALVLVLLDHGATGLLPLGAVVVAGGFAIRFPAIPFYYRETAGGCVVAFPADVCARLLDGARLAPPPRPVALEVVGSADDAAGPTAGVPAEKVRVQRDEPSA